MSAVPLAELGHRVTVVDTSADALAILHRRAADAGVAELVAPVQGEVERLPEAVGEAAYDLVLCHGLLEVVDDPDGHRSPRSPARCARAAARACSSRVVPPRCSPVPSAVTRPTHCGR